MRAGTDKQRITEYLDMSHDTAVKWTEKRSVEEDRLTSPIHGAVAVWRIPTVTFQQQQPNQKFEKEHGQ